MLIDTQTCSQALYLTANTPILTKFTHLPITINDYSNTIHQIKFHKVMLMKSFTSLHVHIYELLKQLYQFLFQTVPSRSHAILSWVSIVKFS